MCSLAIYSTTSNGKCLVIGCVVTIEGPYRIIKDIFIPWNFQRTKSNRIEKFLSLVKHFLYHFRDPSVKQIVITSFQLHSNKYNRNIFLKNVFNGYSVIFIFNSLSLSSFCFIFDIACKLGPRLPDAYCAVDISARQTR